MMAGTAHRPWPLPRGPWVMAQRWHDVLFAHWPLPREEVRRVVPSRLEVETFDGQAWVGIVPFRMTGVRLRGMPALPWLSAFPELNVRTYVRVGDKPGVYFFSLDAGNRIAVGVARRWFRLPYFHAAMSLREANGWIHYASRRIHRGAEPAELRARYRPTGDVFRAAHSTMEHWLTERYCLYTVAARDRVLCAEIHHPPWPLKPAQAEFERNTMAEAAGLRLPDSPPLLHFARQLDVVVWPLKAAAS